MSKDVKVMAQGSAVERPSSGLGEGSSRYLVEATKALLEGTGRHKCNVYGSKRYTSSTGLTTIDLTSWTADQGAVTFTKVRYVIVVNNSDLYDADLKVGGNANEPAGLVCEDKGEHLLVHGGGHFAIYHPEGVVIANGTDDQLDIDATTRTVDWDILIAGE